MKKYLLELSQMINQHPIKEENDFYKVKYINALEYFVQKYSLTDEWSSAMLSLYKKKLLNGETPYHYHKLEGTRFLKKVFAIKFKPFKFFTYRYCFLMDCVFMNAYNDLEKGEKILEEISVLYHRSGREKIRQLFEYLYQSSSLKNEFSNLAYMKDCWDKNREFLSQKPIRVLITANMSAGKSTLLNALVGKKVNRTQNDACTSKVHHIRNKPFEDSLCYEWDHLIELDADYHTLMEDNRDNKSNSITVGTYFRTTQKKTRRIWFIDTPGVNSSQDEVHRQITEQAIKSIEVDLLIYLLNGENIGTEDDRKHLLFIAENYKGKIVFVVNKLDRFRKNDDSVEETLKTVKKDLEEIGFTEPEVVPISAYASYLAKMKIFGDVLNEDELDEFDLLSRKLKKEEYQFDTYYPKLFQNKVESLNEEDETGQLLQHAGILQLEQIIYNLR